MSTDTETKPTKHMLQLLIEHTEHEPRSYTGRGMNGRYCLGVCLPEGVTMGGFISDVLREVAENGDMSHLDVLVDAFAHMRTDNMGRGTIVFFQGIPYFGANP